MPPRFAVPYPTRGSVLGEEELEALSDVVRSQLPLSAGTHREAFEEGFRRLVGSRHALSVTSGTVALALAVNLLDLRPGDEVIATPQTYKATVQPLLDRQVRVRFCDVEPHSLNADPASVESLVTDRTRAILLVHYGGLPADMESVMRIARPRGIVVVEDCAHALGALHHGRRPGALADIGCFSFHSSKNITTLGEGGMVTLRDDAWAERLDRMRSNESDAAFVPAPRRLADGDDPFPWMLHPGNSYTHACVEVRHAGTNATLSEAGAAVGLVQLGRLDALVARRRAIAARITAVLERYPFVRVVREPEGVRNAYHLYTFFLDPACGVSRNAFVERLVATGVEMQLRYFPLHLLPEWRARGHGPGECPVAERMWFERQVNLPCQPGLSDEHVDRLLAALETVLDETARGRPPAGPAPVPMRIPH
ncbi:DegT/DnrJ/EryC1/StrS family aminotransferase [Streptomyces caatingaensis]|uniref:Aminotransferase DegT n=1 Tax=Streptomyces caatingaensis TaxID=1678637 RepID=A0A0K9XD29_9ACTN|nr:DegT/DnrJ/EryC1/StrS family aminotransferase [Streptomyces caatingaensis]KNB50552.1 aminotransferase DegT [Streptomyces caatingaensis]